MQKDVRTGALLLGWGLLTAWGLVSLTLEIAPIPGGVAALNAFTSLASLVGCLLVLACGRITARKRVRNRSAARDAGRLPMRLVWGLACATSAFSLANQIILGLQAPTALAIAAQAGASLAYIGLMYLWFRAYVPLDPQQVEEGAIWSTALCAVIFLAATLLPYPAALALCIALPPASAACLSLASRPHAAALETRLPIGTAPTEIPGSCPSPAPHASPDLPSDPSHTAMLATALGVVACGLVFGLPTNLAGLTAAGTHPALVRLGNLGGLALAAVLALWYVTSARRIDLSSLFRMLYPLAAVSLFLTALPNAVASALGLGLAMAGQWALYVFIWINAVEGCCTVGEQTPAKFAQARISFDTGGMLAGCLGMLLPTIVRAEESEMVIPLVLFGALTVFALVNAFVFRSGSTHDPNADPAHTSNPALSRSPQPAPSNTEGALSALARTRAERLARSYGLSERESQILERLLRGHSTAAIRNELAIAKGTVDTYIQRIYRKCGVHARQELVDLAEGHSGSEGRVALAEGRRSEGRQAR